MENLSLKALKLIGFILTAIGGVVALGSSVIEDKKMEQTIASEVEKQLNERESNSEEEES